MRRRHKHADMNLDSLLDTMTNVVGILIVVIAVAQLSVGQAVNRIKEARPDSNQVGTLWQEFQDVNEQLQTLQADQADLTEEIQAYSNLFKMIDPNNVPQIPASFDLEELKAKSAQLERDKAALESELEELDKQNESLGAELIEFADKSEPSILDIPVPVLEDVPEGMTPVSFACRNGRIFPFEVAKPVIKIFEREKIETVQDLFEKRQTLKRYFDSSDEGDLYVRIKFAYREEKNSWGTTFTCHFEAIPRRLNQGETLEDIKKSKSIFYRAISSLNPDQKYIRFVVWSDSFDMYQQTWALAQKRIKGLRGNWTPIRSGENFQFSLGGGGDRTQ